MGKILKWVFIGFITLFGIYGLSIVTGLVSLPFHAANATVNTAHGVIDKTMNAENALFNYENFHDLYNGAIQQKSNIKNAKSDMNMIKQEYGKDPSQYSSQTQIQFNSDMQNYESYQQMYEKIVSEYNSDSQKFNRAIFKSHNLPSELPTDYSQLQ